MPGAGMFFMSTTCVSLAFSRPCLLMQASITTPMPLESVEVVSVDVIVSRGDVTVGARGPGRAARRVTSCRARVGRVGAVDAVEAVDAVNAVEKHDHTEALLAPRPRSLARARARRPVHVGPRRRAW